MFAQLIFKAAFNSIVPNQEMAENTVEQPASKIIICVNLTPGKTIEEVNRTFDDAIQNLNSKKATAPKSVTAVTPNTCVAPNVDKQVESSLESSENSDWSEQYSDSEQLSVPAAVPTFSAPNNEAASEASEERLLPTTPQLLPPTVLPSTFLISPRVLPKEKSELHICIKTVVEIQTVLLI